MLRFAEAHLCCLGSTLPGQCAMLGLFCATRAIKNAGFHEKHGILHVSSVFRRHFHSHLAQ